MNPGSRRQAGRGRASATRRAAHRAPAPTLLVYCEGKVTEHRYIYELARYVRATTVAVADEHGDPKFLVERAVSEKRRRRSSREPGDQIWCVFDVDEHARLADAIVQARDNGIGVALSNPSFELWALLHFEAQTAYIEREPLRRKLQTHIVGYDKLLPFADLLSRQDDATARAQALTEMHVQNGSADNENPSTTVWMLVDAITRLRS